MGLSHWVNQYFIKELSKFDFLSRCPHPSFVYTYTSFQTIWMIDFKFLRFSLRLDINEVSWLYLISLRGLEIYSSKNKETKIFGTSKNAFGIILILMNKQIYFQIMISLVNFSLKFMGSQEMRKNGEKL